MIGCNPNSSTVIKLRSGNWFDFANPQPEQFTLEDIAGALSKICRFGAQIDYFYSVAEHSCNCYYQSVEDGLPRNCLKAILFHDATEAFCGDIVRPLKSLLKRYKEIEHDIANVIAKKFCLEFELYKEQISKIDNEMLFMEKKQLFKIKDDIVWTREQEYRKLDFVLRCSEPSLAEQDFLVCAAKLGIK